MAKIGLFDHAKYKTTKEIIKWFTNKGHEVRTAMYADPAIIKWSDVTLFEWIESNLQAYTLRGDPPLVEPAYECWKDARNAHKKIVTRAMDIEIYAGHFRSIKWEFVDKLIYPADHIWELMNDNSVDWSKYPHLNPEKIPLSIDMNEWHFKKHECSGDTINIGFMGDMWWAKSPEMMFQVLAELKRQSGKHVVGHIRGDWHHGVEDWFIRYRDNIVKELKLDVRYYDYIPDLNDWLDQLDFFVTTNMKDAFSLIVAQAASKGIPVYAHHFWGAPGIYPKEWIWETPVNLAARILYDKHVSEDYRTFVQEHYANEIIMPKWESVLL